MQELVDIVLQGAVFFVIAFVCGVLVHVKLPVLGYVGAGWIGTKLGRWAAGQLSIHDPLTFDIRSVQVMPLVAVAVTILVLLVVRFASRRRGG